jgi:hypothetical protein
VQSVALSPLCILTGEAANNNFIVFGLTRPWLEPYRLFNLSRAVLNKFSLAIPFHHGCFLRREKIALSLYFIGIVIHILRHLTEMIQVGCTV